MSNGSIESEEASPWAGASWQLPELVHTGGGWYCFRRWFETLTEVNAIRSRVACDSKYWLSIDGTQLINEGQLKRGPAPTETYYDDFPLAVNLAPGRHLLAVLVWHFGKSGFSHSDSGQPGLLFHITSAGRTLAVSDEACRAITHPAYRSGERQRQGSAPNYRLSEADVVYDARISPESWRDVDFADEAWPTTRSAGSPGDSPWGALRRRPIPAFKDHGLARYENSPAFPFVTNGSPLVCHLRGNIHVTPYMEIEAPAGLEIEIRTDNYMGGGSANVKASYTTRSGRQCYESLGWMNGHEVHYTLPAGVIVHDLRYRRTRYDTPWEGDFDCDNDRLNTLWKKSCATLDVCMRDNYMDCPDRERAQWWGDVVIQAGSAFYACDADRSAMLARKGIYELIRWQRDDGTLYSPVPAGISQNSATDVDREDGCWSKEIPAQMLASIGWYGFATYHRYSGDTQTIRDVYSAVKKYLGLWQFDEKLGLVAHRSGGWDWIDWGANVDTAVSLNAWYALAQRGLLYMAKVLDQEADANRARATLKRHYEGFNRAFWRKNQYRGDAALPYPDDRAQAMAVLAGFVDRTRAPKVAAILQTQHQAGPYMEKYVVEALLQLGLVDEAMQRLQRRYAEQLDSSISTLWEGWSVRDATWGGGTYNHAWSGGAITLLQQYVAGIAPVEPAFKSFVVRPRIGSLNELQSSVPTRHGNISLEIDVEKNSLALTVPPSTKAILQREGLKPVQLPPGKHKLRYCEQQSAEGCLVT